MNELSGLERSFNRLMTASAKRLRTAIAINDETEIERILALLESGLPSDCICRKGSATVHPNCKATEHRP